MECNLGFSILNNRVCEETSTIAATGVGRSGTTMLSRVLISLDIPMGQQMTSNSAEDKEIQRLIKVKDMEGFHSRPTGMTWQGKKKLGWRKDPYHSVGV